MMEVHTWSHLYAAQAVIPLMIKRGGGYLLNTSSAAGLLTQMDSGPYAVSKHASVASPSGSPLITRTVVLGYPFVSASRPHRHPEQTPG